MALPLQFKLTVQSTLTELAIRTILSLSDNAICAILSVLTTRQLSTRTSRYTDVRACVEEATLKGDDREGCCSEEIRYSICADL